MAKFSHFDIFPDRRVCLWSFRSSKVSAVLIARGLMSDAEAAEAVMPLVNKRIVAIRNVTAMPGLEDAKPGMEQPAEWQPYRGIIRLTISGQDA